jgi:hypothetical protein
MSFQYGTCFPQTIPGPWDSLYSANISSSLPYFKYSLSVLFADLETYVIDLDDGGSLVDA